jgi:hypothetical protein
LHITSRYLELFVGKSALVAFLTNGVGREIKAQHINDAT